MFNRSTDPSQNETYVRLLTRKIKNYNPVPAALNATLTLWRPPGNEIYTLNSVFVRCATLAPTAGTVTTPPQIQLQANNLAVVAAAALPVVPNDVWELATRTGVPVQFSRLFPLQLKLTTDVVLGTATGLTYDLILTAVKIQDFGF